MAFDPAQSAGYLVNYLARLFAQALFRRLTHHDVTRGQFAVLLLLWEREGWTQAQMAERIAVEQPTMANTLKRMERDGLIVRRPDPQDGRQALVHLTPRGRALEPTLTGSAREVNAAALAGLGAEEKAQFFSLLKHVIANLARDVATGHEPGTTADPAPPPPPPPERTRRKQP